MSLPILLVPYIILGWFLVGYMQTTGWLCKSLAVWGEPLSMFFLYMYIHIYIHMRAVHMYIYVYVHVIGCVIEYAHIHVYLYVHTSTYTYIYIHTYTYTCICLHMCLFLCPLSPSQMVHISQSILQQFATSQCNSFAGQSDKRSEVQAVYNPAVTVVMTHDSGIRLPNYRCLGFNGS